MRFENAILSVEKTQVLESNHKNTEALMSRNPHQHSICCDNGQEQAHSMSHGIGHFFVHEVVINIAFAEKGKIVVIRAMLIAGNHFAKLRSSSIAYHQYRYYYTHVYIILRLS